ncbi:hypothetical protein GUJ93_ZPchr0006g44814 [Zizania palustris]|uniref:Uncharacterized protein n=1 Tax=Zizania palustris TaxID=103762 RepID=A0A8J5W3L3_ZIZPA|nr:hypothetical protein GUJ93_ZPchr0006g44814 [Zizania palustris]
MAKFTLPMIVLVAIMAAFLVTSSSARPLIGDGGRLAGDGASGESILQLLRRVYLQQLAGAAGSGPSCQTNSSNGGCPPPSGS